MATILSVETAPGSGIYSDLSAYLLHGSLTIKLNTVDLGLLDPPAGSVQLTAGVTISNPTWSGTIAAITTSDPVDLRNNHVVCSLTATNAAALPTDTAPFDLSDVPGGALVDYTLEDGSGSYELEGSTDWAPGTYQVEGAYSNGYSGLSVQTNVVAGGPNKTLGRCQVVSPGLRPGNQFLLTSLNQGYSAAPFQVTQVTTRWPALSGSPFFDIEFGDTPQTLAAWTLANAVATPAALTPQATVPSGPVIFGTAIAGHSLQAVGSGIVTIATATFTVSVPVGHTLTVQILSQIDCRAYAWDNFVATPRRASRATLSGGIYTGAWQEMPAGTSNTSGARQSYDLGSAPGIALAAGTYTTALQIDAQEFNQIEIFSGYVQAVVTTV